MDAMHANVSYGVRADPATVTRADWVARFGRPGQFFSRIRQLGIGFVEFRYGQEHGLQLLEDVGAIACGAGLCCSIHPYPEGSLAPEVFGEAESPTAVRAILQVAQRLAVRSGDFVSVVFHGGVAACEPHHRPRKQALTAGNAFFRWAERETRRALAGVRVLAETQMPHDAGDRGLVRLGDTWQSCLELLEGTCLGICWDFGHTFWAARLGKHAQRPPARFVRRVEHVHAHDAILPAGGGILDHRPLGTGVCPWRRYGRLLSANAFAGRVLFELELEHWCADARQLETLLRFTIGHMEAALGA
jgi:sugar phosphate isomerase/epimerase